MTLTETRPEAVDSPAERPPEPWLGTADHKRLGTQFLLGSLVFLAVGGIAGLLLRVELLSEGMQLELSYSRVLSLHITVTSLLFLVPAWIGMATWLVPLQIGASRLAFPRLQAFALWLFLLGGALLVTAHLVGSPAMDLAAGTTRPSPDQGASQATSLAISGTALVAVASLMAAMNLAVTVLKFRTRGLTLRRLPMFSWATLVTSLAMMLATPVFVAGLVLLYLDRHFGGELFLGNPAGRAVWRHTLWLFGRPEAFLVLLPGLGAACDIVATHTRRPLLGADAARGAVVAFAVLSFATWAAGGEVANALVLPTYTPLTALVAVTIGLLVLLWLGTAATSRPQPHVSLMFVGGAVVLMGVGALHVVAAGVAEVHGRAWATGHLHTVAFGAPTLLVFAGLYHWAPKMTGRHPSPRLGACCFLGLFGGFLLLGLGSYLLGYDGAPAHVRDYPFTSGATTFSPLALVGAGLTGIGLLAFAAETLRSAVLRRGEEATDDPYEGPTLEWATTSPPPPQDFEFVPEVRSERPLADLHASGGGRGG